MDAFLTRRAVISTASLAGASVTGAAVATAALGARGDRPIGTGAQSAMAGYGDGDAATVTVRHFGAIGDGQFHALSTKFASLTAARAEFPSATALSESLDGLAIQAAIDLASRLAQTQQARRCVHIPAGRYRLSRSIRLPNNVALIGDGIGVTIIDNQNTQLDAPLIVNSDLETVSIAMQDLSLHGGTHGIRIDAKQYVDGYDLIRVGFQMQSDKNFECNKLLQIGTFIGCIFAKADFGVYVGEWTTNVVSFHDCRFEDHARTALHLNGAECVNFFGGRFESGRGVAGPDPTLYLAHAAAVNFHGVYFEGTPAILLREVRSRDGVTFTGCHFTGSANPNGPPGSYRFESDGIVNFGSNDWGTLSPGPAKMAMFGPNAGLVGANRRYLLQSPTDWRIQSEQVDLAQGASRVVAAFNAIGTGNEAACVTGKIEVSFLMQRPDGTSMATVTTYQFAATFVSQNRISVELTQISPGQSAIRLFPGRTADGRIAILANAAVTATGKLRWTLEGQALASALSHRIEMDID